MKQSTERGIGRLSVYTLAIGMMSVASHAVAQEAPAAPVTTDETTPAVAATTGKSVNLERVEVTGSRIKKALNEGATTVFTLDRKTIESTGAVTLGELVTRIPSISGSAVTAQSNNPASGGSASISLRALGSQRTLLLVDGERVNSTDINAIPTFLIDRVDVLKEGASTIYGADAVGGVVNFITRKRFSGFEVSQQLAQSDRGDATTNQTGLLWGAASPKGYASVGAAFQRQGAIKATDRNYSDFPYSFADGEVNTGIGATSRIPTGRYVVPRTAAQSTGVDLSDPVCGTAANVTLTRRTVGTDPNQRPTGADFRCYNPATEFFNFQAANYDLTPTERHQFFGKGEYEILPSVKAFGLAYYTNTTAKNNLAQDPFDTAIVANNSGTPVVVSANNAYNPFGVNVNSVRLRLLNPGPRVFSFDTDTIQWNTGLKGVIADKYNWDVTYGYGKEKLLQSTFGEIGVSGFADAVGPTFVDGSGTVQCGSSAATQVGNCTPVNLFSQPSVDQLTNYLPTTHDFSFTEQTTLSGNITGGTGDFFKLPAGEIEAALGAQYLNLRAKSEPDSIKQRGLTDGGAADALAGRYDVREWYVETDVPLVKDVVAIKSLDFTFGYRYSDYSTFGTTYNRKFALEYRPIDDVLVRATYQTVFRAPQISDLFGGDGRSAAPADDPCVGFVAATATASQRAACQAVPDGYVGSGNNQINTRTGSNPDLKPETGHTIEYGLVYSPNWLPGLTTHVDIWRYMLNGTIGTVGAQNKLNLCYSQGLFCGDISREDFRTGGSGDVLAVDDRQTNSGILNTNGVDFGANYIYSAGRYGRFTAAFEGTYLAKIEQQSVDGLGETLISFAGQYVNTNTSGLGVGTGALARLKTQTSLTWTKAALSLTVANRFISDIREAPDGDFDPTAACTNNTQPGGVVCSRDIGYASYVDIFGSYKIPKLKMEISGGVNNVGDDLPPIIYSAGGSPATDTSTYDLIGRYYFVKTKFNF